MLVRMFGRWALHKQKAVQSPEEEELHERHPRALLTIFMYFVQISALLKVDIYYQEERDEEMKEIGSYIAGIFRFDVLGYADSCLIKNITPVEKTFYKTLFIAFLFLALLLMYVLCGVFRKICRCGNFPEKGCGVTRLPNGARFIGTFVLLVLFTYELLSESLFSLLRCEHIYELGENVLYIDGNYVCYVQWQYWVIIAVCLYIVPLFFILATAPVLLKEQKIKLLAFALSLFVPLLALPFILFLFIKLCTRGSNDGDTKPPLKRFGATNFVVNLIVEPYNLKRTRGLCWEGVIIFRRLVLVIIAILVPSMIIRHVLLVFACLLATMVHVRVQPFKKFSSNLLETASLLILLCIAIMNLLKAVYFDSGEIPRGSADTLLRYYDIIEECLVTFFPLVLLVLILLLIIVRVIALPCDPATRQKLSGNDDDELDSHKSEESGLPSMHHTPYNVKPGSATPAEGAQFPHQLSTN